jgi:hypothetical protein
VCCRQWPFLLRWCLLGKRPLGGCVLGVLFLPGTAEIFISSMLVDKRPCVDCVLSGERPYLLVSRTAVIFK